MGFLMVGALWMEGEGRKLHIPLTWKKHNLDKSDSEPPACGNPLHGKNSFHFPGGISSPQELQLLS